jgi:hypothetical protein
MPASHPKKRLPDEVPQAEPRKERRPMRFAVCLFVLLVGCGFGQALAAPLPADTPADSDDLLCAHAPKGFVQPLPAPFSYWMVLVCGPQSQALVPVEGMIWFAPGTTNPVSILALPPGVPPVRKSKDYNPSYAVRFKSFFAAEVEGEKRKRIMKLLNEAEARKATDEKFSAIDRIFQLDAVSSIYDMRYNIYFYLSNKLPRAAIVCIDDCKQRLFFDVLNINAATLRHGID